MHESHFFLKFKVSSPAHRATMFFGQAHGRAPSSRIVIAKARARIARSISNFCDSSISAVNLIRLAISCRTAGASEEMPEACKMYPIPSHAYPICANSTSVAIYTLRDLPALVPTTSFEIPYTESYFLLY